MKHLIIPFTLLTLSVSCFAEHRQLYDRIKELQIGQPTLDGQTVRIPVQTNDGDGYMMPVARLCQPTAEVHGQTIEFSFRSCIKLGQSDAEVRRPQILTIPYTGPTTYNMVYVGGDDKKTPIGPLEVNF